MATMTDHDALVTLGVDSHADIHVAAALDRVGKVLGTIVIPTTTAGFAQLLEWAGMFGTIDRVGVEGTGAWGARLTRWLEGNGLVVIEVDRADRKARRFKGKSDVQDAINAARMVLSEQATGSPKSRDGQVEMIRVIKSHGVLPSKHAPRPPTSSTLWWSPRPTSCMPDCAASR